jgi:hypothetical protein
MAGALPGMPPGGMPPGLAGDAAGGDKKKCAGGALPPGMKLKPQMIYGYEPSFSFAVVGAAALLISMTIGLIQLFRYKCWFFGLVTQACMVQVAGAIARIAVIVVGPRDPKDMTAVMITSMMFSMVPSLLGIGIFFVFTRVIWFVTPNDKRNKHVIGLPVHHISFLWGLAFVIPDMVKGVMGIAFKELAQCDPHSFPVRVEEICMVIQLFVFMLYTVWTVRFMQMSNHWLIPGEAEARNWRKLGWTTVIASAVMTVRLVWSIVEADAKNDKQSKGFVKQHEYMFWIFSVLPCLSKFRCSFAPVSNANTHTQSSTLYSSWRILANTSRASTRVSSSTPRNLRNTRWRVVGRSQFQTQFGRQMTRRLKSPPPN